jgi:hypothetical protein
MQPSRKAIGLLLTLSLLSTVSCANSIPPNRAGASVQCTSDCVAVTKGLLIEHAELFNEVIRLRMALAKCEGRQ